ncbi:MAG: tetraprenyl-beta-curcumene synthase family protein [Sporomusa sp.]
MGAAFVQASSDLKLLTKFVKYVFPLVDQELLSWRRYAQQNAMHELAEQALDSIDSKKFHCQGGSIYSLYKGVPTREFIKFIVALQTISDYLDNLCDRAGIADETAFRQLHLAMSDACDPARPLSDYYAAYPFKDDGGYLEALVNTCRSEISKMPSFQLVKTELLRQVTLYSELQTYKHLAPEIREERMLDWISGHTDKYPGLSPWEVAAATGSTLSMFMLCAAACSPSLTPSQADKIVAAYVPWINGLHILLDYFIDGAEDRLAGELNFVAYYSDQQKILDRLTYFNRQATSYAATLPEPAFVTMVVNGLLAMYLSDAKTDAPSERVIRDGLLSTAGLYPKLMYKFCRLLRRKNIL